MRYLTLSEVLEVHRGIMAQTGGAGGLLSLPALQFALAQAQMRIGGEDLYPALEDKAAALGFALVMNHPFLDGNKRTGHAAMEVFLLLNGHEIRATVDEQEQVILQSAASEIDREVFTAWLRAHVIARV